MHVHLCVVFMCVKDDIMCVCTFVHVCLHLFSYTLSSLPSPLPPSPLQMDGVPGGVATASYQTRIIVRDVTGKYTWDCAVLYGTEPHPSASGKFLFILVSSIRSLLLWL